jgi:3-hydroxyacyl-[acyl-carrier-protein] dehydratase
MAGAVRVARREGDSLTGSVSIEATEPVLSGHFPGFPIFPGVCLIECAHQTVLTALPDQTLCAIERTRFLSPVFPGDEVTVEITPIAHDDGWLCNGTVLTTRKGETVPAAQLRLRYGPLAPAPPVTIPPVEPLGHADIKAILPHRDPILLVDDVEGGGSPEGLVGVKAVTPGEPSFAGLRADDEHIYPQVLMVESFCQAAGVLAAQGRPNPDVLNGKVTLFGAIKGVRFHATVRPGDVMRQGVSAVKITADAAVFQGHTFAGGRPVMTVGQIVIALRPASAV